VGGAIARWCQAAVGFWKSLGKRAEKEKFQRAKKKRGNEEGAKRIDKSRSNRGEEEPRKR